LDDIELDPQYLLWAMVEGQDGVDLHAIMLSHVPERDDLLAYSVLCGIKVKKFVFKPWAGEPKCEICEERRKKLTIRNPEEAK